MPKGQHDRRHELGPNYALAERFWSKVDRTGDCWLWTAATFRTTLGYGQFQMDGRPQLAHRVAWFLTKGVWPKLKIAHTCDEPRCVRPSHLFEATPLQNNRDMIHKGRNSTNGKLSDAQCREIRERVAQGPRGTQRLLSREFGVSEGMISLIVHGIRRTQEE